MRVLVALLIVGTAYAEALEDRLSRAKDLIAQKVADRPPDAGGEQCTGTCRRTAGDWSGIRRNPAAHRAGTRIDCAGARQQLQPALASLEAAATLCDSASGNACPEI